LERIYEADVLVFATPLYIYTVSGLMKDFMDRMLPTAQPYILERGGHFIHPPRRPSTRAGKFVLISNAGFPERHHFSGLEETFRRFTDSPDVELAGVICCAGGELLHQEALRADLAWYLETTKKAGREVVEQGCISEETQAVLDRPLVDDPAAYAGMANAYWESLGVPKIGFDDGDVPAQLSEESVPGIPLPPPTSQDTMRDMIAGMATVFDPQAAGDLEAVIQFKVTENGAGGYYLDIAQGKCAAYEGEHPAPTLTVNTPADVWMAISRGELNGATALMAGKYSVKGDVGLLMRFEKLFSSAPEQMG
jgi:putative sterol carrier protein